MSAYLKCPDCGSTIRTDERYCGICGKDTLTIIDPPLIRINLRNEENKRFYKRHPIVLKLFTGLVFIMLVTGGVYWWLHMDHPLTTANSKSAKQGQANSKQTADLKQAICYLPEAGLQIKFNLRYPGGGAGTMERLTAQIVPDLSTITELELIEYKKKTYGYAYHYYEHADGVYMVYDQRPDEAIPVLKNNLHIGQSWTYKDMDASTVWTVMEMGKKVDLGFIKLTDCLVIKENSDAADYPKLVYYAPGIGRVMETTATDGQCLMVMSSLGSIEPDLSAKKIRKWATNYAAIETFTN